MSEPILRLTLTNTTPLLVGWHDPYIQDPMGIRATEIKGLWRWWCRAFIAGAMFDQGMLCGKSYDHVLLVPEPKEAKAISCLVGKILGLGYAGERKAEASKFRLFIEVEEDININIKKFKNDLQRIKLLSLEQEIEGLSTDPRLRFALVVEKVKERYKDAEDLALKILIASLQLNGIGKGSRRGLGSLDIVSANPGIPNVDIKDSMGSFKSFIENIYESAKEVVRKHGNECGTEVCRSQTDEVLLPPLPAISKSTFKGKNIFQISTIDTQRYRNFVHVHNFFIRLERCRQLAGRGRCKDNLRTSLGAWFLGLPRGQRSTGYKIKSRSVGRRPSPIILAYHTKDNIFGQGIFVSIFLSGDWPKNLEWIRDKSSKPEPIEVDFNKLKETYDVFIKEFDHYLSRGGLVRVSLWP